MIKSTPDNTFFKQVTDILVVTEFRSSKELKQLVKLTTAAFSKGIALEFLFVVPEKKLPDMLPAFKGINYICWGDFNFVGALKNEKLKSFTAYHSFDAMICLCWEMDKNVLKFTNSLKIKYRIGYDRESLPKFDLAFSLKEKSEEELIQLTVKYLKQL